LEKSDTLISFFLPFFLIAKNHLSKKRRKREKEKKQKKEEQKDVYFFPHPFQFRRQGKQTNQK